EIVRRGREMAATRAEFENLVRDAIWDADLITLRQGLIRGWWIFQWFIRDYRNAVTSLQGFLKLPLPKSKPARSRIVASILSYEANLKWLKEVGDPFGREAFGSLWRGPASDWNALELILKWDQACQDAHLPKRFREIAAQVKDPSALTEP